MVKGVFNLIFIFLVLWLQDYVESMALRGYKKWPTLLQATSIPTIYSHVQGSRFGSATPFKVPIEQEKEAKIIDPNDYQAVLAETKELFNSENPFLNLLEPSSLVPAFPESQPAKLDAFDRNFMMGSLNEGMQLQRELEALLQDVNVFN